MKRAAILLTLIAVMAFAPSVFAGCLKCNTTVGCFGATQGWVDCFFDGECHRVGGFCQGFTDEETELAATYTVAAVHIVETENPVTAQELDTKTLPAPPKAEKIVVER